MSDLRRKNTNWTVPKNADGNTTSFAAAQLAVLMDLRDELQTLNRLLNCTNFLRIPSKLDLIARNTTKPKRRKP